MVEHKSAEKNVSGGTPAPDSLLATPRGPLKGETTGVSSSNLVTRLRCMADSEAPWYVGDVETAQALLTEAADALERRTVETPALHFSLPVITPELYSQFKRAQFFEPCLLSKGVPNIGWSQELVDFLCILQERSAAKANACPHCGAPGVSGDGCGWEPGKDPRPAVKTSPLPLTGQAGISHELERDLASSPRSACTVCNGHPPVDVPCAGCGLKSTYLPSQASQRF